MKATQRRKDLLSMIQAKGGLSLKEITEQFDVSKMTIHRDLDVLESRGLIRRIFGGAVPADDTKTAIPCRSGDTIASGTVRPAVPAGRHLPRLSPARYPASPLRHHALHRRTVFRLLPPLRPLGPPPAQGEHHLRHDRRFHQRPAASRPSLLLSHGEFGGPLLHAIHPHLRGRRTGKAVPGRLRRYRRFAPGRPRVPRGRDDHGRRQERLPPLRRCAGVTGLFTSLLR